MVFGPKTTKAKRARQNILTFKFIPTQRNLLLIFSGRFIKECMCHMKRIRMETFIIDRIWKVDLLAEPFNMYSTINVFRFVHPSSKQTGKRDLPDHCYLDLNLMQDALNRTAVCFLNVPMLTLQVTFQKRIFSGRSVLL